MSRWWILAALILLPALARADSVTLRNGQIKTGRIVGRDGTEVRLEVDYDGIKAVISFPRDQVIRIEEGALPRPAAKVATAPATATAPAAAAPTRPSRFLHEMAAVAVGRGTDNPDRLPADLRQLWQNVVDADSTGKLDHLLLAMKILSDAMADDPDRLNAICLRTKEKTFGSWMAQTRWQLISNRYKSGVFDLSDVSAIERPELLAILRAQTPAAVEPLRQFFPPTHIPGQPYPQNNPLLSINAGNALVVKDRGLYAAAVLYAQIKLDPALPRAQKEPLITQLAYVRRCIQRANEFEPAARAALQREERARREAEERARRQSLLHSAGPHR